MRVTNAIIFLCIFFFLFQLLVQGFTEGGVLQSGLLLTEPWRIITCMFLHANTEHLMFNMFALFVFGNQLERRIGGGAFLFIYFMSGLLGSIGFMFFSEPWESALGASGAIYGIIGALVVVAPRMIVYFFGLFPLPMAAAGIVYALIELFGFGAADNIAHSAHLLGLAGGYLFTRAYIERVNEGAWEMSMNKAIIFSVVFSTVVALFFGYVNYNDGIYTKTQACFYGKDDYEVIGCFENLVREYKENVRLKDVCAEYLRAYRYVNASGFAECKEVFYGRG